MQNSCKCVTCPSAQMVTGYPSDINLQYQCISISHYSRSQLMLLRFCFRLFWDNTNWWLYPSARRLPVTLYGAHDFTLACWFMCSQHISCVFSWRPWGWNAENSDPHVNHTQCIRSPFKSLPRATVQLRHLSKNCAIKRPFLAELWLLLQNNKY